VTNDRVDHVKLSVHIIPDVVINGEYVELRKRHMSCCVIDVLVAAFHRVNGILSLAQQLQ
jgi:hypothetical protein